MIKTSEIPVIVLYYNKVNITDTCINSLLKNKYNPEHIFCFSNGSKKNFSSKIENNFPQVNHLLAEINTGYAGGFNRSLHEVFKRGYRSAFFLTNDTTITPSTIQESYSKAKQTGAALVAPCIKYAFKPDNIHSIGGFFSQEDFLLHHYHSKKLQDLLTPSLDYIPGTALYITREAFLELSGTDEEYFMYWEDVDLSFRAHQSQIKLARAYNSIVYHGVGKTCHKKPIYTSHYFHRNRILFVKKFFNGLILEQALEKIRQDLLKYLKIHKSNSDHLRINYLEKILDSL